MNGEGTKRPVMAGRLRDEATKGVRRGFSLIEVLMAIIILAIGMISIAALFPAGIAQQRQSVDDVIGPVVANNALAVIRSKLRSEDFGTFEEFGFFPPLTTVEGDWPWLRPAFIFDSPAIDIFNATGEATADEFTAGGSPLTNGLPYNSVRYDFDSSTPRPEPVFIFTQGERYYPMRSGSATNPFPPRPQYVWDCMFRRFQGRVQVAIFVYRVAIPGGGSTIYGVAPNLPPDADIPPVPFSVDLAVVGYPFWVANEAVIDGTPGGMPYDASDATQSWQEPRQWVLDQNNNIHRVLSQTRASISDPVAVELVRPVPVMPSAADNVFVYSFPPSGVVSHIWYIPAQDANGLSLTPVYVTVREL